MKIRHTIDFNGNLISEEVLSDQESPNKDYEDHLLKRMGEIDSE